MDEGSFPALCPGCKADRSMQRTPPELVTDDFIQIPIVAFLVQEGAMKMDGNYGALRFKTLQLASVSAFEAARDERLRLRMEEEAEKKRAEEAKKEEEGEKARVKAEQETQELLGASSKRCPNPACGIQISHYQYHDCHHIKPGTGCPSCHKHFCYKCLTLGPDNGARWSGRCSAGCQLFCYDGCGCPICPDCKPRRPCNNCGGRCPACAPE